MEKRLEITRRERQRYNIDTLRNETPPGFKAPSAKPGAGNRIIHANLLDARPARERDYDIYEISFQFTVKV